MPERILIAVGGIIIGIIAALISVLFIDRKRENTPYKHTGSSKKAVEGDIQKLKKELARLQAEIDEVHRVKSVKKACSTNYSTIGSGYDFETTCEELDNLDDYDLVNDWDTTVCVKYGSQEEAEEFQDKLKIIDESLEGGKRDEIETTLDQLKDLCFNYPENVELLYRIGKAHVKLSEGHSDQEVIKDNVNKGIKALSTAISLSNKHAEVHKWYAILLGLRSQFQPLQKKAQDGFLFKKHCDLACALKPRDAVLHYLLGRFDYEIAGLSWFEKLVAKPLFGESLNSTYTDALTHFLTAEKLSVFQNCSVMEKKENRIMIGKTLIALDNRKEAREWFLKAKSLGTVDRALGEEIDNLLKSC